MTAQFPMMDDHEFAQREHAARFLRVRAALRAEAEHAAIVAEQSGSSATGGHAPAPQGAADSKPKP